MGPIPFALDEVLRATGAVTIRWPGARHVRPIHDLRYATPGALFFPLYMHVLKEFAVKELVRTQATGLVVYEDHLPPWLERYPQLGVLSVRSPFQSYLRLARLARSRVHGPVAGITGSSGKSSTKGFLAAILQGRYRVHANPGSYNVISDTAAVLMGMTGDPTEAAVLEMGLGRPGDIDRMAALAKPWVSVITKVTNDHLDATKGSWEQLVLEKGAIGRYLPEDGFLVINADDPGCSLLNRSDYRSRVHTFGTGPTADLRCLHAEAGEFGTTVELRFFGQSLRCRLRAFGTFQAENAAAAALAAYLLGIPPDEIRQGLEQAPALARRFEVHPLSRGLTIIDDSFKMNIDEALQGLTNAAALSGGRRRVALLSGAAQLEEHTDRLHYALGMHVAACGFSDLLLLVDQGGKAAIPAGALDQMRAGAVAGGLPPERIRLVQHRQEIPQALEPFAQPETVIYCKADQVIWAGPLIDQFRAGVQGAGFDPIAPPGRDGA